MTEPRIPPTTDADWDDETRALVEGLGGMNIFDANPKIVAFLDENGMLVHSEKYQHRYPHCWRCKNPVIFRATPQWFISMDEVEGQPDAKGLRQQALAEIERVKWHPAWGQDRMRNMFKGRHDLKFGFGWRKSSVR